MSGFFLGGVQEGIKAQDEIGIKTRALDIKENELAGNQQRQLASDLSKTMTQNVATISGIIQESRNAGASPDQIRKTIAPLVQSFQALAQRTGRDVTPSIQQLDALIDIPQAAAAARAPAPAAPTPVVAQPPIPDPVNVIETIRRKLAAQQPLTPDEQMVFDDATRHDLLGSIMRAAPARTVGGSMPPLPPLPGGR